MKGKIEIIHEETNFYKYEVRYDSEYGYIFTIHKDPNESLEDLISNIGDLKEYIETTREFNYGDDSEGAKEDIEAFDMIKNRELEFLKDAEYINLFVDIEHLAENIKNNPSLLNKKIIIDELFVEFNFNNLTQIKNKLNGKTDNLYFKLNGNEELIKYDECVETFRQLELVANHVNNLGFSPMEKIMYIYDFVRNKVYTEVDENDDKLKSRDLSSSLLGKNIVCVGYSRIFKYLLEKVGIQSNECYLMNKAKTSGHDRNEIYVKDDKYGIDGVYYFDTTWDSKKNENDDKYLYYYRFFAKTRSQMDKMERNIYTNMKFPYYSEDIMWEFENIMTNEGIVKLPKEFIKSINYMSNIVEGDSLISGLYLIPMSPFYGKLDVEDITQKLFDINEKFNTKLSAETLLEILYNVRKIQYYEDPKTYPFSMNDFYITVMCSGWNFEGTPKERFLLETADLELKKKIKASQLAKYSKETDLDKNIEQVKLAKVLRRVYEKKINNN